MPVITSIRRNVKNAGRCSIFVDGTFLAACPIEVALGMGLHKGLEMSSEMERQLRAEDRTIVFRQKAYRFATYKPRTERQLIAHLEKIGCVEEEVAALMLWLKDFKLVDDVGYTERFVAASKERKPLSHNAIRATLQRKGINPDVIDDVLAREYSDEASLEAARRVAEKKLRGIRSSDTDELKQKLVRFMQYRGFSWDVIRTVVTDLMHTSSLVMVIGLMMQLLLLCSAHPLSAQGVLSCERHILSPSINRYQPTTLPVISRDGKTLFIDRKLHPDNSEGVGDNDDIWVSKKLPSGEWSSPIQEPLTTFRKPDALFNFTRDGRSALVVGRYRLQGRDSVQCFAIIHRDADTGLFTRVEAIALPGERLLGKNFYGYLADDKATLLLAIARADSRGDLDLYVSMKCKAGWEKPVSLGDAINTTSFEGAPWLGRDNRTLYFASSGREDRRGKSDLYMSHRQGNSWTRWSLPVNLGPCVNTPEDETSLSIVNNSDTALITSWDPESERPAIYTVTLPSIREQPFVAFTAHVYDAVSGDPLSSAEIELTDSSETCRPSQLVRVANGVGSVNLEEHTQYLIRTKAKYYVAHRQSIGIRTLDSLTPLVLSIRMFDTRKPLASVYFDRGSYEITAHQREILDSLIAKYEVRNISFSVVGYTDQIGSVPFNQTLSSKRAGAITQELVRLGVDASRVSSAGRGIETFGLSTGISENPTSRRVDIFPAAQ